MLNNMGRTNRKAAQVYRGQKQQSKLADVSPTTSVATLTVNGAQMQTKGRD